LDLVPNTLSYKSEELVRIVSSAWPSRQKKQPISTNLAPVAYAERGWLKNPSGEAYSEPSAHSGSTPGGPDIAEW
jgi:hypothetical protein